MGALRKSNLFRVHNFSSAPSPSTLIAQETWAVSPRGTVESREIRYTAGLEADLALPERE